MSMNFIEPEKIEPEEIEMVSIDTVLETLPIQPEDKEWLRSLFSKNEMPRDTQRSFEFNLFHVKKSEKTSSNSFKVLFLDYLAAFPDYFDKDKLSCERIKILPELFTQKQDDKPVVFQAYVADIRSSIKHFKQTDSAFSEAYDKKKQEVREASSLAERICYYIKLQSLPKRTYETGEKPAVLDEKYPMRLVSELEEIRKPCPEFIINAISLPFLLYGKEWFTCIKEALSLFKNYFNVKKPRTNIDPQPLYYNVFYDIDSVIILDVLFNYILNPDSTFLGALIKGEYSKLIEPIRDEIEYLDWSLSAFISEKNLHQNYFGRCRLFLRYLKYLAYNPLEDDNRELFRELSFMKHDVQGNTIRDVLNSIARERNITDSDGVSWTFPSQQKEADDLYEEFIDVIARGAASYPVSIFISPERIQAIDNRYSYSEHEFKTFKQYCEKIKLRTSDDALLVGQFWFVKFHGDLTNDVSHYDVYNFAEKEEFFYKNIFSPFSDDEEFVCRFLSIPQEFFSPFSDDEEFFCGLHDLSSPISDDEEFVIQFSIIPQDFHEKIKIASEYWALYYLACWILKHEKEPYTSDAFTAASNLLMREKISFPNKIVNFILSNNEFDKLINNTHGRGRNSADLLLYNIFAAIGGNDKFRMILEYDSYPEGNLSLYYIRYLYIHERFVQQDFLDFLFTLNKQVPERYKLYGDEVYPLIIIQTACQKGILTEKTVLTILYDRAIQETDPSCIELYKLLKFCSGRIANISLFTYFAEQIEALETRCGKMLRTFRAIEQGEFSEYEESFLYDCAQLSVNFLYEKTGKVWKVLKPLIIAFRASKRVLLTSNLESIPNKYHFHSLPEMITSFFNEQQDQNILRELRADMANDLIDYFIPIKEKENGKTKHQAEQYTGFERKEEGFDLNLREPSPFWRYAYIRALADLGVKMDPKGHFFHNQLEKVSQTDPSKQVREAAMKTLKELDENRSGITGANHKKCLYEAFWWLKYAHMLSLGRDVDPKGANDERIGKRKWGRWRY